MKKVSISCMIACCIVGLLIFGCSKKQVLTPMPSDIGLYLNIVNHGESWTQFKQSQFFQDLQKLELWKDPGIATHVADGQKFLNVTDSTMGLNQEIASILLNKRVDLGVQFQSKIPSVIAIFDLGEKANSVKIIEYFNKTFGSTPIATETYQKTQISTATLEEPFKLSYFFHEQLLIASNDILTVQKAIDIIRNGTPGFLSSETFKRLQAETGTSTNQFYFAPSSLRTIIDQEENAEIKLTLQRLIDEYREILVGWTLGKTGLESNITIDLPPKSSLLAVLPEQGLNGTSMQLIPDRSIVAMSASFIFKEMLQYQKSQAITALGPDGQKKWNDGIALVNQTLGVDIEKELTEIIGEELFWNIQSVNTAGFAPIPETIIGIQIKDAARAQQLLTKLEQVIIHDMANDRIVFSDKDIEKHNFRSVALPFGTNLNPGYCLSDDYLLIATSSMGITEALKTARGERSSLAKDDRFLRFKTDGKKTTLAFQYIDLQQFWSSLGEVVNNYRMFIPKDINPDHLRTALTTLGLVDSYYADASIDENRLKSQVTISVR